MTGCPGGTHACRPCLDRCCYDLVAIDPAPEYKNVSTCPPYIKGAASNACRKIVNEPYVSTPVNVFAKTRPGGPISTMGYPADGYFVGGGGV